MKRLVLLVSILTLTLSSLAYAQKNQPEDAGKKSPEARAEEMVKHFIGKDGGAVSKVEAVQLEKGTAYKVAVKEKSGSEVYYIVPPCCVEGKRKHGGMKPGGMGPSGMEHGMGPGMGHSAGHDMMGAGPDKMGGCPTCNIDGEEAPEPKVTTPAQAEQAVKEAINNLNLKGYSISSTEKMERKEPKAVPFKVNVVDKGGNKFFYVVDPNGFAKGPFFDAPEKLKK